MYKFSFYLYLFYISNITTSENVDNITFENKSLTILVKYIHDIIYFLNISVYICARGFVQFCIQCIGY